MRIALVCDFLLKHGGAQVTLETIMEMFPDAPIYCLLYDERGTKGRFKNRTIITSSLQKYPTSIRKRNKLLLGKYQRAIEEFDFSKYDVVISSSDSYSHGVITQPKTFHLCYCHTPMRYVWDWHEKYLEENGIGFGPKGIYVRKIISDIRVWDRLAAYRVDNWIANSENVKERIKKFYRADSTVIHPPIDINKFEISQNPKLDYFLIVSRLEPYKNISLAVDAFKSLPNEKLVIIGEGSDRVKLERSAPKNVRFLGWQSEEKLKEYYANAKALIFPGEEDFGLTPVESLASGRPVIAYKKGGVLESVTEGETGLFFNEPTPESLVESINKFNPSNFDPSTCYKAAEKFSKEAFKQKFLSHLEKACEEYKKGMK